MPKDNKPPYFPFYVDDFSSDGKVEAMTTEEVGAHILLMCKAWRETPAGSIPDNDRVLARWARMTPDQWADAKAGVLSAWCLSGDGRWHQPRLRREFQKLTNYQKSQSQNGRKGAMKRWSHSSEDVDSEEDEEGGYSGANGHRHDDAMPTGMTNDGLSPSSSPSSSKVTTNVVTKSKPKFVPPSVEEVQAYCQARGNSIDPELFIAHYTTNGWVQSSGRPVKDWKSCVITWEKNSRQRGPTQKRMPMTIDDLFKTEGG
jgi:uncharacterized protein YdaU (DUF1376 family)